MTDTLRTPRVAQCVGKEAFQSPALAMQVIKRGNRSRRHMKKPAAGRQPYRCCYCGFYHLGSTPK